MKHLKKKSTLGNHCSLSKKFKNFDVNFIKQVPFHPRERKKRSEKLDEKAHIIKEIAATKPKSIKAKRKIDRMKNINDYIRAAN